jgi:ribosomal 50S subunit-recycling heat shock protein
MSENEAASCRIDVWLWRARLVKTRGLGAQLAEAGRIRLTRGGGEARLDKPSRLVRIGDELAFALGGRLTVVRVEAMGERRGPASEAQTLYTRLADSPAS